MGNLCVGWPQGAGAVLLLALLAGCGKEDMANLTNSVTDAASQVKQSVAEATTSQPVTDATAAAKAVLGPAGSMDLTLDAPLKVNGCYVQLIASPAGRSTVLQLKSYRDSEKAKEPFPSVFVRALVPTGTPAELNGQTVSADLFVMKEKDGPVWFTRAAPVKLKITSIVDKQVSAAIESGELFNTATLATVPVQGTFSGELQ